MLANCTKMSKIHNISGRDLYQTDMVCPSGMDEGYFKLNSGKFNSDIVRETTVEFKEA